ncbi:unnamed protein product [Ascophyllum nodosum]
MTLGVVSFALFLLQPVVYKGTVFLIFEFAHYVIFFVAIFAVLQLVLLGASTYPIKRAWDVAAYKSKDELVEGYRWMMTHVRPWSVRVPLVGYVSLDVFHWRHHWRWIDRVEYHIARCTFIREHGRSASFDFARYAVLVTDKQILGMANFSFSNWVVLIALHWLYWSLNQIDHEPTSETLDFFGWFVVGLILCGLEFVLLYVCMLGMRKICIKLGADPADPLGTLDAVLEKIWVAPVTHVQHTRLEHDNSVPDHLAAMAAVPEEKSVEAPAPLTESALEIGGTDRSEASGSDAIVEITKKDAFVIPGRNVYKIAVELLMLLNSYYLAVYAVYFISPASKSSSEWFWIVLLPLPIACGVLIAYRRVIPLIALLSSIVVLNPTDIADVEQETEELSKLRRRLVMRLEDVLRQEIKALPAGERQALGSLNPAEFLLKRWDTDGNKSLSYDDLQKGLSAIGLVLSSRQRKELLRLADPDRNGRVDIHELADLLYDVSVEVAAATEAAEAAAGEVENVPHRRKSSNFGFMSDPGSAEARVERLLQQRASSSRLHL